MENKSIVINPIYRLWNRLGNIDSQYLDSNYEMNSKLNLSYTPNKIEKKLLSITGFSHGSGGIAYSLLNLFKVTKNNDFF